MKKDAIIFAAQSLVVALVGLSLPAHATPGVGPEPGTVGLFGLGLAAVVAADRYRRRK